MKLCGSISDGTSATIEITGNKIASVFIQDSIRGGAGTEDGNIYIAPGFIDIQVNGFAGVDFNHPDFRPELMEQACRAMLATGVTGFFPTLITNSYQRLKEAVVKIRKARQMSHLAGDMIKGIHIEGPHINPEDGPIGAHSPTHVAPPDWDAFKNLHTISGGLIHLTTIAPEIPGAMDFIDRTTNIGVVVSLGHCAPEPEVIKQAAAQGARMSTHLGNAAHEKLHRHVNYIQAQMAVDGLMASIICDGHHLPDYFVQNLVRAKGPENIILITDATSAAGSRPGQYTMGELKLKTGNDGILKLPHTAYLAGSTLTMDRAIINCAKFAGINWNLAVNMATANPARLFSGIGGILKAGMPADLIRFRLEKKRIAILEVYLAGELVFRN